MTLKLDMAKAYDRVEWGFLASVMEKMGFRERWISLMLNCISTVSYSVVCNGEPKGLICPQRGLRQGDPLSPYLFLICAEGLSAMLRREEENGGVHGVKVADGAPPINHLFFADDSLIFGDATMSECKRLKEILNIYEAASGQKVNYGKSAISFSASTSEEEKTLLSNEMGMKLVAYHEKYLGLPTVLGRDKGKILRKVRERVKNRVEGWHSNLLSLAGKEVLVKAVLQAVPTYSMSVFKLPIGLCDELNAVVAKFWWGKKGGKGVHWKEWEFMCKAKENGGVGFREFGKFNQAMVGKQAWRLIEFPNSLAARVLKARYFPNNSFLQANMGSNPSFVWRSIMWGRELVEKGCIRRIGNGEATSIYYDKWIPRPSLFKVWSPMTLNPTAIVNDLLLPSGGWNIPLIYNSFNKDDADLIIGIPTGQRNDSDQWRWFFEKNGRYTVNSGYKLAVEMEKALSNVGEGSNKEANRKFWKVIWGLHVPNKIKLFMWRAVHDILPCSYNLYQRKVMNSPSCFRCGVKTETTLHALWDYEFSRKVWKESTWKKSGKYHPTFASWCEALVRDAAKEEMELFSYIAWFLWTLRNDHLHGKPNYQSPNCIISKACSLLSEFKEANKFKGLQKTIRECKWQPPCDGMYKLNIDGAIDSKNGRRGLGAVVRNERGELMGASAQRKDGTFSPLVTELLALKAGICFAIDLRTLPVVIEMDCAEAVRLVNAPDPCTTGEGFLVEEVKSLINACSASGVIFNPRECNKVAHGLARSILYENEDFFCIEQGPEWLMELVKIDSESCNPSYN